MNGSLKILILEDSPTDAELLERFLKKEVPGCIVMQVNSKKSFVKALDNLLPDIILSDHSLPQFDSAAALQLARRHYPNIPFILVTGTVSEEFAVNIIKLGADDYFLKDRIKRLPAAIATAIQKRKSENSIRNSEAIRRLIMNSALDAIVCINTSGRIIVWTPQAEKMFGWKEAEVTDTQLTDTIIPRQYQERHREGISRYLATGEMRIMNKVVELTALKQSGEEFPIELLVIPIKENDNEFFCAFIRDITERKELEHKLLEQQRTEQLKITATALEAQEKERNALGLELHDNISQILVGIKLILSRIKNNKELVDEIVATSLSYLQIAIDENRKLAHTLVTPDLVAEPFTDQIKSLCRTMLEVTGITVTLDTTRYNDNSLNDKMKIAMYRILQEQCTNIVKYAKASAVDIILCNDDKNFKMTIADNGVGMDTGKITAGIGLRNMNSRLSIFNGTAKIDTKPGKGFRLSIETPL